MRTPAEQDAIRKQTNSILEKTIAVLQLTALAQFGCGSEHFYKNSLEYCSCSECSCFWA